MGSRFRPRLISSLHQYFSPFVKALSQEAAKESKFEQAAKLMELDITKDEWSRIRKFLDILKVLVTSCAFFSIVSH